MVDHSVASCSSLLTLGQCVEPDSDQSSHIQMDRCLDDVFEFKLVLAVLLVRVWFFVTIWPRNLIGASVMHFVSPSARWNVDLGTILP